MSYLLDTHTVLWALLKQEKLSANHRKILTDKTEQKFFSTISMWEVSLKFSLGKLDLGGHTPVGFFQAVTRVGLQLMPPMPGDFTSFYRLPPVDGHKDPFDRMLIWQAIQNDLTLLSRDSQLPDYGIHGLKLA